MSTALLQASEIGKSYGRSFPAAVSSVSLQVMPGRVVGIVGESGSGKTTLGRVLAGLLAPSTGLVRFQGTDLQSLRGRARRRLRQHLQYVHQDPAAALDPRMRVADILHEPLQIHTAETRARRRVLVHDILAAVGAPPALLERFPHQLSGGQARRIGLARILLLQPRLIVLDEPTAGLDLLAQESLLMLLDRLRQQYGVTYVLISHDVGVVRVLCDEVIVMFGGKIVEQGEAAAILSKPTHPYTKRLLSAEPRLDGPRVIDSIDHTEALGWTAAAL